MLQCFSKIDNLHFYLIHLPKYMDSPFSRFLYPGNSFFSQINLFSHNFNISCKYLFQISHILDVWCSRFPPFQTNLVFLVSYDTLLDCYSAKLQLINAKNEHCNLKFCRLHAYLNQITSIINNANSHFSSNNWTKSVSIIYG